MNFESFLRFCVEQKASDIHLQALATPMLRIGRHLRSVEGQTVGADELKTFLAEIAPVPNAEHPSHDPRPFMYEIPGLARFRCQAARQLGRPCLTLRVVPLTIPPFEATHLPPALREIAQARTGLVLISGEPGDGRTSTLATMIDQINASLVCKLITVESPVEFRYPHQKALITHHEVGSDVLSTAEGLALAAREDPDTVAVGDLAEPAAIAHALSLAESGRQVLAVCNGPNAVQTIERLVAKLPPEAQRGALRQIADSLEAVICLRMATTRENTRYPAVEILRGGPFTTRALLENRTADLQNLLTGRQGGMQSFDQHLIELYQAGIVSGTEAMRLSTSPETVATGLRATPSRREPAAG